MRPLVLASISFLCLFLVPAAAYSHTFEAPDAVQTAADGSFSFEWAFTAGPGDAFIREGTATGILNVTGADQSHYCGCDPGCFVAEGDTFSRTVTGNLVDLSQQGQVGVEVWVCGGGFFFKFVQILVPGSPPPLSCEVADPCLTGITTQVSIGNQFTTYLLARNYDSVGGVQTAFEWGDWQFLGSVWSCQSTQLTAVLPGTPGGPDAGTVATAFDCITGGETEVIGTLLLIATGPGCLTQVESTYSEGTHIVGCDASPVPIPPENRGSICVGMPGANVCDPVVFGARGQNTSTTLGLHAVEHGATAVQPVTWGDLKNRYRR